MRNQSNNNQVELYSVCLPSYVGTKSAIWATEDNFFHNPRSSRTHAETITNSLPADLLCSGRAGNTWHWPFSSTTNQTWYLLLWPDYATGNLLQEFSLQPTLSHRWKEEGINWSPPLANCGRASPQLSSSMALLVAGYLPDCRTHPERILKVTHGSFVTIDKLLSGKARCLW